MNMLMDIIWKAFERTGDTRYYLEYIMYRNLCKEKVNNGREKGMDRTG